MDQVRLRLVETVDDLEVRTLHVMLACPCRGAIHTAQPASTHACRTLLAEAAAIGVRTATHVVLAAYRPSLHAPHMPRSWLWSCATSVPA